MGLLRKVSGEGLAIPDVREGIELALLERMYSMWPPLGSSDGWGVMFGRELNATDDRPLLCEAKNADHDSRSEGMWVIEGKHLRPFKVDVERAQYVVLSREVRGVKARVPGVARARLAYREVAFPGQQFSLVAAMLPAGVVSTHTVFCLKSVVPVVAQWCLCALLNSLICNYLVRVKAGAHVTATLLHAVPVPKPLMASRTFRELARLGKRLARSVGVGVGAAADRAKRVERVDAERYARVQALAARLYGVRQDEFEYVVGTFGGIDAEVRMRIVERYRALASC
jgi:hypothetical protein